MKSDSELKRKIISLIITTFVLTLGVVKNNYMVLIEKQKTIETNQVLAMESKKEYSVEDDINNLIINNNDVFEFYSNTFGISIDDLKKELINDNNGVILNANDIGNTNKNYDTLDENLLDYLFNLKLNKKSLFKQKYSNGNNYSKEYIYGLINYYSNIYNNVDISVLSSIAYIESGNLNSKHMLKYNNVYGGMGSHGLIKYQNIEFGVLSYVKMMSEKYYNKGLNSVELIAKKYNLGSKSWINNVNKNIDRFNNQNRITNIETLNQLK